MLVALLLPPNVHAATVLTLSPSPQTISQLQTATYIIGISSSHTLTAFTMSVSGVVGTFSANPVTTDGTGMASVDLVADASTPPTYCPGTYSFSVTATGGGDTQSIGGVLTVTQVGSPLVATVYTDRPSYQTGQTITISLSVSRPAEGQVTVTGPSGYSPSTYPFQTSSAGSATVPTFVAGPTGTYSVSVQADDYCGVFSSTQTTFTVTPNTYDVSISNSGVPSQYSANVQVDGQQQGTIQGSQTRTLSFPIGSTHTIIVDQYVSGDTGVRYYASQNSWSVSSTDSHIFSYQTQYQFNVVTDPAGIAVTSGGGWYNDGQSVQTNQAPPTVAQLNSTGIQYAFKDWVLDGAPQSGNQLTVTMDKPHTAVATYSIQYQLVVDSPGGLGNPQGAGYYDAGSTATFSVTSPVGFLVQQVLVQWQGDYNGTNPQGTITMDKPKTVHAVWTTSYLQLMALIVVAIAVVAGALFWKKRKGPPSEAKTTSTAPTPTAAAAEEAAKSVKCASCGTDNPTGQKFCTNCGVKLGESTKQHT